ncbi:unnamed protein product, partial [marine sediment metagenome]
MTGNNIWETPSSWPTQPTVNADYGYPEHTGVTIDEVFYQSHANDEARQFKGVNYRVTSSGVLAPYFETVDQ